MVLDEIAWSGIALSTAIERCIDQGQEWKPGGEVEEVEVRWRRMNG
jgi:hypothetical protein